MMISAVRTRGNELRRLGLRRGFTLLEAILAMVLMLIVISIGLAYNYDAGDKETLRKAAVTIERMASQGHAMSVLHQKPIWLRFEENMVVLAGADVTAEPVRDPDAPPVWLEEGEQEEETHEKVYDTFGGDAVVSIRRWGTGEDAWVRPEEDEFFIWQFQSTGLCEPISIKLETEDSWMILHMNPLTARVDEEETEIR